MRTLDLQVGKEYIIEGFKCRCTYNGIGIKAIIIEGESKGRELSAIHGQKLNITKA